MKQFPWALSHNSFPLDVAGINNTQPHKDTNYNVIKNKENVWRV